MLIILLDITFFKFSSGADAPLWTLLGVIIGAVITGLINYFLQRGQFKHNFEMFYLQNKSKEQAKIYLVELLNHIKYPERKFTTLRKRIGAFTDEELKLLLVEVGAQKSLSKTGEELWYLKEREQERTNSTPEGYR